jgi:hypothetical protein
MVMAPFLFVSERPIDAGVAASRNLHCHGFFAGQAGRIDLPRRK